MIHSLDRNWSMIETFGSTRKKKGVALYGDLLDLEGHVGLKPMSCRRVESVNTFSASSTAALAWARDSASSSAESLLMKGGRSHRSRTSETARPFGLHASPAYRLTPGRAAQAADDRDSSVSMYSPSCFSKSTSHKERSRSMRCTAAKESVCPHKSFEPACLL